MSSGGKDLKPFDSGRMDFPGEGRRGRIPQTAYLERFDSHRESSLFFLRENHMNRRIGVVSIIITSRSEQAARVNSILSEHGDIVIGRMGLPYPPAALHILSLIVHGTTDEIGAMTGKLGSLDGVKVKSALQKVA